MMNKFKLLLIALFTLFAPTSMLHAADGKAIYAKSCTGCHGTEVFTRADRRVKDLDRLKTQVRQCSYAIEAKWFDEEINAVTHYLNSTYYKF